MGEIVIKLDDEKLVSRINELARAHRISPEAEAASLIRKAAFLKGNPMDRREIASRIAAMTPANSHQTDSTDLVREDRLR